MAYRWQMEIRHEGLNKYRLISGTDRYVVERKAEAQLAQWDEMWARHAEKEHRVQDKQAKLETAAELTRQAGAEIERLGSVLADTLQVDDTVDWARLKDTSAFVTKAPAQPPYREYPREPLETDEAYQPKLSTLGGLFGGKDKKIAAAKEGFRQAHQAWQHECAQIKVENERLHRAHLAAFAAWERDRDHFLAQQQAGNEEVELRRRQYIEKEPGAVIDYCDLVLTQSSYPDYFPQQFELEYNPETAILLVDYVLPDASSLPTLKEVKYVQTRDSFDEKRLTEAQVAKLYDELIYQVALRTLHELFEADAAEALEMVVFNGWVNSIDRATGKDVSACIVSVQAKKDEFLQIQLDRVDPKVCFKNLKGVGSSKLHTLTPVAPIMQLQREDRRFITSREVVDGIDQHTNLAAMDWEDFEHLIRELFEQEFAAAGGECKVTQASRDGGVDAVAFDPDPIRGGKIVIQAKRYTNTVGVAAVRDLYGTVVNEGATKGILVTTSDYGPDAYDFAKGKPLTLLSGANLLHLLEKHGRKATIDLKAAKLQMAD